MKHLMLALSLVFSFSLAAQSADAITGTWWNAEKTAKVEVYKSGKGYAGKIIWLKKTTNKDGSSPRLDEENPNAADAKKPLMGKVILTNLLHDEGNEYEDGSIYDPKTGKTYSCEAKLEGKTLYLRGYVGISLIGKTSEWTRVD